MPRITPIQEECIKCSIYHALAFRNFMTQGALLDYLEEEFKHRFDHRYIKRLTDRVFCEMRTEKLEWELERVREEKTAQSNSL